MNPYYFLFFIGIVWTLFAVVQDMRTKNIANWLNFSLLAFALSYRGIYALVSHDYKFFLIGLAGFGLFFVLSRIFYYGWVFAGGDVRLMTAYGALLPFANYGDVFISGLIFIFILFLAGLCWTLIYSVVLVLRNKQQFFEKFFERILGWKWYLLALVTLSLASFAVFDYLQAFLVVVLLVIFPILYLYVSSIDSCMVVFTSPKKLEEGDWLDRDVKVKGMTIAKSVNGLSKEEIMFLQKAKKKVWVKYGLQFTPAFLIALLFTVCVYVISEASLAQFFSFLL